MNYSIEGPHYNFKDLLPVVKETLNRIYESVPVEVDSGLITQVIFDILYDKYLAKSPSMTLYKYCRSYVCYDWLKPTDEVDESNKAEFGNERMIDATRKWMVTQIGREISRNRKPAFRENSVKLGRDPEKYLEFLGKRNSRYKEDEKKPKHVWDFIYYNGHPDLITSKQYKRSFVKGSKNYSAANLEVYFKTYDRFVENRFMQYEISNKDYFNKSMDYYHLEMYKRIDFMYKLAVRMETAGHTVIDRDTVSVKRFHPVVFWPCKYDNHTLCCSEKNKYYRPLLMFEEQYQNFMDGLSQFNNWTSFDIWQDWYISRAKTYELFNYHYKFASDNYDELAGFIRDYYNVLAYYEPNKKWVQKGKKLKREKEIQIINAMRMNKALFWDSDK